MPTFNKLEQLNITYRIVLRVEFTINGNKPQVAFV